MMLILLTIVMLLALIVMAVLHTFLVAKEQEKVMQEITVLNPENATEVEVESFSIREAARAIVYDKESNVALLHVTSKQYYKLPGGGLDKGEDKLTALKRECIEEIGCDVEVTGEIGTLTEYRKLFNIKQISYCYTAKVVGEKRSPAFTEKELSDGFEIVWLPYKDAITALETATPTDQEGREYIVPRDCILLKKSLRISEAKENLEK